eukprot:scaffold803_cov310-Pinguiococcus_pyrenoidosus.AAC.68
MSTSEESPARERGRDAFRAHLRRSRAGDVPNTEVVADIESAPEKHKSEPDEGGEDATSDDPRADRIAAFEKDEELHISVSLFAS